MTKTKLKALSVFLLVAILIVTMFVANYSFIQRAFAEEAPDSEVDSGYTLPEDETAPEEPEGEGGNPLLDLGMSLTVLIVGGVVFVFVILPGIILGIVVSARRNRR